ncbi:nucleotidyltransferase substrate binding protein [Proteiniborus sp. MB09-C3]|uniref:nucleotidyltransferase substrate binding protein n=1 Tax=Proteiniborus sp. MB09-C3 TaxID=3050072 RepID=UPI002556E1C4|nr:nucleotidyltransferase substrate binding protein [Proteiniborus sp. MB09-C3]WIV12029.1 nucleotidyltransferase substrate binding protein [Proteiniborus sp. MB09-C3]
MEHKDIRWIQRFSNYKKAFIQVKEALELMETRNLSKLEKQGLIQAFEYTYELAWKTLRDFLESKGNTDIYGARDAVKEAFKLGIIENGEVWMQMIKNRNLTSHTYDENTADGIIMLIEDMYFAEFNRLRIKMEEILEEEDNDI